MSRQTKHLALLLTSQMVCVAVGLWVHHHYATTSVRLAVEEKVWARIRAAGDELEPTLRQVSVARLTEDATWRARAREIMQRRFVPNAVRLFVVDADRQVLLAGPDLEPVQSPDAPSVSWTLRPDSTSAGGAARSGQLDTPAGPYLAVSYSLQNGDAHLVIGYSVAEVDAQVATLTHSFPMAAVVTLLWTCALLGITVYMIVTRFCDRIQHQRERFETESLQRMESLVRMRDAIVFGLAKLAESRDPDTGDHLERMSIYATTLASVLRHDPDYSHVVTPAFVRLIGISSALHDIGKVGIEDAVLLKPGPLDEQERTRMQEHTEIGSNCLLQIEQRLGSSNFLQMAREITQAHHERWDGSGYPRGLSGTEIPLAARIVAIADVYDALSSKRVYKQPYSHDHCVKIIINGAGMAFDPQLVQIWMTVEGRFRDISRQYWSDQTETDEDDPKSNGHGADLEDVRPLLVGAGADKQGDWS